MNDKEIVKFFLDNLDNFNKELEKINAKKITEEAITVNDLYYEDLSYINKYFIECYIDRKILLSALINTDAKCYKIWVTLNPGSSGIVSGGNTITMKCIFDEYFRNNSVLCIYNLNCYNCEIKKKVKVKVIETVHSNFK